MDDNTSKSVLVISLQSEKSTDEVIKYLTYYRVKFFRINYGDLASVKIQFGTEDDIIIRLHDRAIKVKDIASVWYRRGKWNFLDTQKLSSLTLKEIAIYKQYQAYYEREVTQIESFLNVYFKTLPHINNYTDNKIDKLSQLMIAKKNGLLIPETLVTDNLDDVESFLDRKTVIIKAIQQPHFFIYSDEKMMSCDANYSVLLKKENFLELIKRYKNNKSLLTFYQEYIEKRFEIRVFYLLGKMYSMAIFSQENEATKIDFRNEDHGKPCRTTPFLLPVHLQTKIINFMNDLGLNSGSLDIIYSMNKDYFFLEVNPIGQYDWLTKRCNYYIDKLIAQQLFRESK